nr:MAG TPA: hypothetical protein [Caudoviricetes sp.]
MSLKWQRMARKLGVSPAVVSFVFMAAMSSASQCNDRGSLRDFDPEDVDFFGDFEDGTTSRVMDALTDAGFIEDGRIAGWEESQSRPSQEEADRARLQAAERKRRQRAKEQQTEEEAVTPLSHDVTPCHASSRDVTGCHAVSHDVTHTDQIRSEKIRTEDLKHTPLTPQGETQGVGEGPAEDCSDVSTKTQPVNTGLPSRGANASWWREFASLWDIWPNQQGKDAAWAVYYDLRRRKIDMPPLYVLRDKASAMIAQDRKFLAGYTPELKTWLREHRWNDEPCPPRDVAGRGRTSREQQMATDVERAAEAARRFEDFFEMAADEPAAEGVFA